jgi:hypothetical protein
MVMERAAAREGWFRWFGVWLHVFPHEVLTGDRPPYFVGTVRELCLAHGIEHDQVEQKAAQGTSQFQ